jgi:nitroreductase
MQTFAILNGHFSQSSDTSDHADVGRSTLELITSRHNTSPRRLVAPGPTDTQVLNMFTAAAAAPDHGEIRPWRFVLVPENKRVLLASVFGQALLDRDVNATAEQVEAAREKAYRAPFLTLAIARLGPSEPSIDPLERMVSVGAAIQNFLLYAHSLGFGGSLTSGQAMHSEPLRQLFQMGEGEQAVCCINVGTVDKRKPMRQRPVMSQFVSSL